MKLLPLTRGLSTKIDDADFERVAKFKWYAQWCNGTFYAARRESRSKAHPSGKLVLLHRYLCAGERVDHRNFDTLDNQRDNLRPASVSQNQQHQRKQKPPSSSRFKGVCYAPQLNKRNPWIAYISVLRKRYHIGYFSSEERAARAYNNAAVFFHGDFAVLNPV